MVALISESIRVISDLAIYHQIDFRMILGTGMLFFDKIYCVS